jgi:hypothetical protein
MQCGLGTYIHLIKVGAARRLDKGPVSSQHLPYAVIMYVQYVPTLTKRATQDIGQRRLLGKCSSELDCPKDTVL